MKTQKFDGLELHYHLKFWNKNSLIRFSHTHKQLRRKLYILHSIWVVFYPCENSHIIREITNVASFFARDCIFVLFSLFFCQTTLGRVHRSWPGCINGKTHWKTRRYSRIATTSNAFMKNIIHQGCKMPIFFTFFLA